MRMGVEWVGYGKEGCQVPDKPNAGGWVMRTRVERGRA